MANSRFEVETYRLGLQAGIISAISTVFEASKGCDSPYKLTLTNMHTSLYNDDGKIPNHGVLSITYALQRNEAYCPPLAPEDPIERAWKAAEAKEKEERAKALYGVSDGGAA